ncbi:AraC family transcriptional regulator [Dysgonomonas sp. 521]|uniref:helix-turn-helix domain-containing protein n=1 Tax=Dysgonomonas sp. 521 TaxID=2302932 RepID=UPI0013D668A0|nr:AraC family transcriptional regulator [Dysgonomonas sp. 521]NDV93395.1 AraC family transcriptional regulator [Dysgonomonas sp. 521]
MAKLLYAGEHLDCPNYDNRHRPAIEEKFMGQGQRQEVQPWVNKIMFVLEGEIEYSMGDSGYHIARRGQFLFLPANRSLWVRAVQETHLGIVRLYDKIQLCDCFRLENLLAIGQAKSGQKKGNSKQVAGDPGPGFLLEVNPVMESYLEMLGLCHRAGLKCRYYNEGKIRELMFILRAFYPKEDLYRFFSPTLSTDTWFSQFIMSNYNKYDNLSELAAVMKYTVSGFEKKFRKVFAEAPYAWMRRQRAREAYHCINTSNMTLKEISSMFGFNSHPAFIRFIRQHYGLTPGQIRKNSTKGGNG